MLSFKMQTVANTNIGFYLMKKNTKTVCYNSSTHFQKLRDMIHPVGLRRLIMNTKPLFVM